MIKPKASVQKMSKYDPPLENRKGQLRLDFNENTIGCSPKVIESLRNLTADDLSAYPEYKQFINKLASFLRIEPDQVIITNGADEAIKSVIDTYVENGEEVIIPVPSFKMFEVYASISGAKILRITYEKDLSFPTKRILETVNSKTRMIILASPNNPTGTEIPQSALLKIIRKAKNSVVLIDEAYYQYSSKTYKKLIKKYDNVIIVQTFSKAFGLAGLRLGYIISNEKITFDIQKVVSPYSVNSLALIAGSAVLDDIDFVNNYVAEVREGRKLLKRGLKRLGIKTFPSKANFLLADFGEKCGYVYSRLKERGILVRDRSQYPLLRNCLRIGIGTPEQCLSLINETKSILREKTLLFDMDGVLVDVSNSYRVAIKKTVEYFTGQDISKEEIQHFKERGGYNNDWDLTEAVILGKNVMVTKDKIIKKFQEFYFGNRRRKGLIENEKWLLPKKAIEKLYRRYRLGIVTGRPKKEAIYSLKKVGVLEYFDVVVTMEDVPKGREKPSTFGIQRAINYLGGSKASYFGDSIDDVKAAKEAGIEAVGIIPPNINSPKLKTLLSLAGAKTILENINDIWEVLK